MKEMSKIKSKEMKGREVVRGGSKQSRRSDNSNNDNVSENS